MAIFNHDGMSLRYWLAELFTNYGKADGLLEKSYGLVVPEPDLNPTSLPGMAMNTETEICETYAHAVPILLPLAEEEPVNGSALVRPSGCHTIKSSLSTHLQNNRTTMNAMGFLIRPVVCVMFLTNSGWMT
jgi:hypothetical protein